MQKETGLNRMLAAYWARLNPAELSTGYLVKMMTVFVTVIVLAGVIGQLG